MKKLLLVAGVAAAFGFTACNDVNIYNLEDHQGAYILNEGEANSSISYYNYEREQVTNDYYQKKNNGTSLGSGAKAITSRKSSDFVKGIAFVTQPTENKIELINLDGFVSVSDIDEFAMPTDVSPAEEELIYVSHGENMVSSYDFKKNEVVKSYEVGAKPQKLISSGKYLYAACAGDGTGAKVFVIDMSNNAKVDTVDLVFDNPIDMVVDIDRNVWVYCSGATQGIIKLERTLINEEPFVEHETIDFELGDNNGEQANPLTISRDGRILYYVYGDLKANSVYIKEGEALSDVQIVAGDYQDEAFNGIDFDGGRGRIMGLTTDNQLVVLRNYDGIWSNEEVYDVGDKPVMTIFNF